MELQSNVGVHTEREIVVEDREGQGVLPLLVGVRVRILLEVQFPAVQVNHFPVRDVAQDLADGFVGVAE